MTIPIDELQKIDPTAIITLFELELIEGLHYPTGNPNNQITTYRWHSGVAENSQGELNFGGHTYSQMPITAEGFDYKGTNKGSNLPRPTLKISNLLSTVSTILQEINNITPNNDLIGAVLTRKRTFAKFLSISNFSGQTINYVVTVQNVGGSDYFYINGVKNPTLSLTNGNRYRFVQSDSSNTGHPLILKNELNNQLTAINGVTTTGVAGTDMITDYVVIFNNQAARYSCSVHGDSMGNTITVTAANNPDEDASMRCEDDIYVIDRKSTENREVVEFECAAKWDTPSIQLPRRQALPREFPGIGSFHA